MVCSYKQTICVELFLFNFDFCCHFIIYQISNFKNMIFVCLFPFFHALKQLSNLRSFKTRFTFDVLELGSISKFFLNKNFDDLLPIDLKAYWGRKSSYKLHGREWFGTVLEEGKEREKYIEGRKQEKIRMWIVYKHFVWHFWTESIKCISLPLGKKRTYKLKTEVEQVEQDRESFVFFNQQKQRQLKWSNRKWKYKGVSVCATLKTY